VSQTQVCSCCLALLNGKPLEPGSEQGLSHGLCRYHQLLSLRQAALITREEATELAALEAEVVTVAARVPAAVYSSLMACVSAQSARRGHPVDQADVFGLVLSRETNRMDWERPSALRLYFFGRHIEKKRRSDDGVVTSEGPRA
jgi:hypothetical protein